LRPKLPTNSFNRSSSERDHTAVWMDDDDALMGLDGGGGL